MAKEGSAEATIRNVKRKTRRKYSAEEKIRIVVEGLRGELTIAELYRLGSPFAEDFAGVQYMSKDHMSGVLFAFLLHRLDPVTPLILYPRGLVPDRRYTIEGYPDACSGAAWMNTGVVVHLANFGSTIRRIWGET